MSHCNDKANHVGADNARQHAEGCNLHRVEMLTSQLNPNWSELLDPIFFSKP